MLTRNLALSMRAMAPTAGRSKLTRGPKRLSLRRTKIWSTRSFRSGNSKMIRLTLKSKLKLTLLNLSRSSSGISKSKMKISRMNSIKGWKSLKSWGRQTSSCLGWLRSKRSSLKLSEMWNKILIITGDRGKLSHPCHQSVKEALYLRFPVTIKHHLDSLPLLIHTLHPAISQLNYYFSRHHQAPNSPMSCWTLIKWKKSDPSLPTSCLNAKRGHKTSTRSSIDWKASRTIWGSSTSRQKWPSTTATRSIFRKGSRSTLRLTLSLMSSGITSETYRLSMMCSEGWEAHLRSLQRLWCLSKESILRLSC